MKMDIFGEALLDFQLGNYTTDIKTILSLHELSEVEEDTLPLKYLFRDYDTMPALEQKALDLCRGEILDIGCGAGSHSLYLQQKRMLVTALDRSIGAIETCRLRGIENRVHCDILNFNTKKFDTLLLLMNGIGIAGTLKGLDLLLKHFKTILKSEGQILLDSSDIIYMFYEDDDGGIWLPADKHYYGEVSFSMQYKGKQGNSFEWLYLDYQTLQRAATAHKFKCELVREGEHYDYLARLTL